MLITTNDIINYEISIFFSQGAFLHQPPISLSLALLWWRRWWLWSKCVSALLLLTERDFMLLTTLDHRGLAMNENEWILEAPKVGHTDLIWLWHFEYMYSVQFGFKVSQSFISSDILRYIRFRQFIGTALGKRHRTNFIKLSYFLVGQNPGRWKDKCEPPKSSVDFARSYFLTKGMKEIKNELWKEFGSFKYQ